MVNDAKAALTKQNMRNHDKQKRKRLWCKTANQVEPKHPIKQTRMKGDIGPGRECTQKVHAELTSGHALASCYSCCMHSLPGLC